MIIQIKVPVYLNDEYIGEAVIDDDQIDIDLNDGFSRPQTRNFQRLLAGNKIAGLSLVVKTYE